MLQVVVDAPTAGALRLGLARGRLATFLDTGGNRFVLRFEAAGIEPPRSLGTTMLARVGSTRTVAHALPEPAQEALTTTNRCPVLVDALRVESSRPMDAAVAARLAGTVVAAIATARIEPACEGRTLLRIPAQLLTEIVEPAGQRITVLFARRILRRLVATVDAAIEGHTTGSGALLGIGSIVSDTLVAHLFREVRATQSTTRRYRLAKEAATTEEPASPLRTSLRITSENHTGFDELGSGASATFGATRRWSVLTTLKTLLEVGTNALAAGTGAIAARNTLPKEPASMILTAFITSRRLAVAVEALFRKCDGLA